MSKNPLMDKYSNIHNPQDMTAAGPAIGVSPYQACLCFLLEIYVKGHGRQCQSVPSVMDTNDDTTFKFNPQTLHFVGGFLLDRINGPDLCTSRNLDDFLDDFRQAIHHSQEDLVIYLRHKIEDTTSSPFALDEACGQLEAWVENPANTGSSHTLIGKRSVFGIFLRQFIVTYTKLYFDGISQLYAAMVRYVTPTKLPEPPSSSFLSYDEDIAEEKRDHAHSSRRFPLDEGWKTNTMSDHQFSKRQLRRYLAKEIDDIERGIVSSSNVGHQQRHMEEMETRLQWILQLVDHDAHLHLPKAYFCRYLNFRAHREFQQALDSLHLYHDYSYAQAMRMTTTTTNMNNNASSKDSGDNDRPTLSAHPKLAIQYASLNLASLHFDFGHFRSAEDALKETIRVAQQHQDHCCVALALAWYLQLRVTQQRRRSPATSGTSTSSLDLDQLIQDCVERSTVLGLPIMTASSILTGMRYKMHHGSVQPLEVWTQVHHKLGVTLTRSLGRTGVNGGLASPTGLGKSVADHDMKMNGGPEAMVSPLARFSRGQALYCLSVIQGKSRLEQAHMWQCYGHPVMEALELRLFLHSSSSESHSMSDVALARHRLAQLSLLRNTPYPDSSGRLHSGPGQKHVYLDALRALLDPNETTNDDPEQKNMMMMIERRPEQRTASDASSSPIPIIALVSIFQSWTRATSNVNASLVWSQVRLALSSSHQAHAEAWIEAELAYVQVCESSGNWTKALGRLKQRLNKSSFDDDDPTTTGTVHHTKVMLAQARLMVNHGRGIMSITTTLPLLMQCLSLTRELHLDTMTAQVHVLLAQVFYQLGLQAKARRWIHQTLPFLMSHGSAQDKGAAFIVLAQCSCECSNVKMSPQACESVQSYLDRALAEFQPLRDYAKLQQIWYLKAHVSDVQGKMQDRERCAQHFIEYAELCQDALSQPQAEVHQVQNPMALREYITHQQTLVVASS